MKLLLETKDLTEKALHTEAADDSGKQGTWMPECLKTATLVKKSEKRLTRAESLTVIMYTNDTDQKAWYKEYNATCLTEL